LRCLDKDCDGTMIRIYWSVRNDPFFNRRVREETWQCPRCHLVVHKGIPTEDPRGSWKLDIPERLRELGYL